MTNITRRIVTAGLLLAASCVVRAGGQDAEPVREPPVPAKLASEGVVYHTISGRQAQVTFTSRAPLENIVGKSNAIVGYAVSRSTDSPAELAGAAWLLPVHRMATGIPLRDEHMAGDEWLDAESFPVIGFTLKDTDDVKLIKAGDGFSTWSATLIGEMAMHGLRRPLRVADAKLSFLAESPKTRKIAGGDLMFIKCSYEVRLSDFGIKHKDVPDKVSDVIKLEQVLRLSTEAQDDGAPPEPGGMERAAGGP